MSAKTLQHDLDELIRQSESLPENYASILFDKVKEIENSKDFSETIVTNVYAELILPTIQRHMMQSCQGCDVMHPSQSRHSCMMTPFIDGLDTYMEGAVGEICASEVCRIVNNRSYYCKASGIRPEGDCVWRHGMRAITQAKVILLHAGFELPKFWKFNIQE